MEDQFDIGNVYYVEFRAQETDDDNDDDDEGEDDEENRSDDNGASAKKMHWESDFYYAVVDPAGEVLLYDDGIEVVRGLNTILQRKKTILQRFADFSLVDVVGAIIAFLITLTFVARYLLQYRTGQVAADAEPGLDKELVSIFTVVVGYYFGRVTSSAGHRNRS